MKLLLTFLAGALIAQASPILTLSPSSGSLAGSPGATVGWGFTLANAANFAVVTSSNFCLGVTGVTNSCGSSTLGTYTDFIASSFVIVGPPPESPSVSEAFNLNTQFGVGSFAINANASAGQTTTGQIVLTYDLYSVDPNSTNFDPIADLLSTNNFLTAPASVSVATPEPYPLPLLSLSLVSASLFLAMKRRYR